MVSLTRIKISGFVGGIVSGVKGVLALNHLLLSLLALGDNNMHIGLGRRFFDRAMNKVSGDIQDAILTDFDINSRVNVNGTGGLAPSMNNDHLLQFSK